MGLYYEPNTRIRIGKLQFNQLHKFIVTQSIKELGDKAVVVLPRNYKELNGKNVIDYIKAGDKLVIEAGVNGEYYHEFTGYLTHIEIDAPLTLYVDDEFYPLKHNNFNLSWDKVSLKELLNAIAINYKVDCPDINLGAFQIANVSAYKVLTALKEQFGLYSFLKENVLYCGFAYDIRGFGEKHAYTFGENVKKNNLKFQTAKDVKIKIKAIANKRNGQKLTYETGSTDTNASLRTLNFGDLSQNELKEMAEKTYKQLCFDGYSGSITGFAMPRTHAGDVLSIVDKEHSERQGNYLIEKSIIRYSINEGFERENTLSFKI